MHACSRLLQARTVDETYLEMTILAFWDYPVVSAMISNNEMRFISLFLASSFPWSWSQVGGDLGFES
jgi:hypothetical protein